MKLKHTHLFRKAARASFLLAAAFLVGVGPARAFVTNNKTVTTFEVGGQNVGDVIVTNEYTTVTTQDAPGAYTKGLTAKGNPHLIYDSSEVGSDNTFLAPNLDCSGKSWEIALQYYNTGDIKSISSITFAVGTFDQQNNTWISSATDIGCNVMFTATVHVTVGGQLVDGKITGTDHREVGVLTGYLYQDGEAHMGSGSDKIMVTLTTANGSALDLETLYKEQAGTDWVLNYCVHITPTLVGTVTGVQKLGVGFGSISYESTADGYIWRGTSASHTWGDQSKIWTAVDLEGKETPEQIFQAGGNALFDGGGNELVTLDQTVTANNVYIKDGSYIFDIQTAEPLSVNGVVTLEKEDTTLTVQGSGRIKASYLAGNGTLAKDGNNTSTVEVSGSAQDFHGNIKVRDGVLDIQSATALSIEDLILENGGQLEVGLQIMEVNGTLKGGGEGTGASAGNITLAPGATLDASDAEGQGGINLTGSVTLNYGVELSQNDFDIFFPGTKPGDEYDLLTVTGDLKLMNEAGQIINATELGENYDAANLFPNFTEGCFALRYDVAPGSNVGRFYLYTVVPEPATCTLSLLALAALAARRRRK